MTPCVLFFDEFDTLGKERGDIHETGEIERVISSHLLQIDDLPSYTIVAAATNHSELLDRAVWRRFQIRLELPKPTQKRMAAFIETCLSRLDEPLGLKAETLVKQLGPISYGEAEQFCIDLLRRQVLLMGKRSMKTVVRDQLSLRAARWISSHMQDNGQSRAGTSASETSGA